MHAPERWRRITTRTRGSTYPRVRARRSLAVLSNPRSESTKSVAAVPSKTLHKAYLEKRAPDVLCRNTPRKLKYFSRSTGQSLPSDAACVIRLFKCSQFGSFHDERVQEDK